MGLCLAWQSWKTMTVLAVSKSITIGNMKTKWKNLLVSLKLNCHDHKLWGKASAMRCWMIWTKKAFKETTLLLHEEKQTGKPVWYFPWISFAGLWNEVSCDSVTSQLLAHVSFLWLFNSNWHAIEVFLLVIEVGCFGFVMVKVSLLVLAGFEVSYYNLGALVCCTHYFTVQYR